MSPFNFPQQQHLLQLFISEILPPSYAAPQITDDAELSIRKAIPILVDSNISLLESTTVDLLSLLETLHSRMPTQGGAELLALRCAYSDASILLAFCHLACPNSDDYKKTFRALTALDKAIIITGPADGRQDFIQVLIGQVQSCCSALMIPSMTFPPIDDSSFVINEKDLPPPIHIQVYDTYPSFSAFNASLKDGPFVLKRFASEWPAVQSWASPDYLRDVSGPGRIVPIEIGSDYRSDQWTQTLMPWEDFLQHLFTRQSDGKVLYLAQHNLFAQFPALRNDFNVPDYVYSAMQPPDCFPSYQPPRNEDQLVINCWFGRGGAKSPAHTDPFFNFYAQICGYKQVWLAPPSVSKGMYPFELPTETNPAANKHGMTNTSRVDVFNPATTTSFPEFHSTVLPAASSITLAPGDVLFFPPGWWHAMRVIGDATSMSISFWF